MRGGNNIARHASSRHPGGTAFRLSPRLEALSREVFCLLCRHSHRHEKALALDLHGVAPNFADIGSILSKSGQMWSIPGRTWSKSDDVCPTSVGLGRHRHGIGRIWDRSRPIWDKGRPNSASFAKAWLYMDRFGANIGQLLSKLPRNRPHVLLQFWLKLVRLRPSLGKFVSFIYDSRRHCVRCL